MSAWWLIWRVWISGKTKLASDSWKLSESQV
jgi:hypothetical protein